MERVIPSPGPLRLELRYRTRLPKGAAMAKEVEFKLEVPPAKLKAAARAAGLDRLASKPPRTDRLVWGGLRKSASI
jgi:hypothetical protein